MNLLKKIYNKINTTCNQVFQLHNQLKDFRFEIRKLHLQEHMLHDTEPGVSSESYCDRDVIVSLTTYGKRLEQVWVTIESIMQQTCRPNKIILWLDKETDLTSLPASLVNQQKRGLEIKIFTPAIRSYKKLIPTLKEFPEAIIITIDDDIIYDTNLLDKLIRAYKMEPDKIHAARTHVMTFDNKGYIMKYQDWKWCSAETEQVTRIFFTGVGGVLYPPHILDDEVLNEEIFTRICPTADDVWFNAMALKKGTKVNKIRTDNARGEDYVVNDDVQDMGLMQINTGQIAMNDPQIKAVYEKYNLLPKLK